MLHGKAENAADIRVAPTSVGALQILHEDLSGTGISCTQACSHPNDYVQQPSGFSARSRLCEILTAEFV